MNKHGLAHGARLIARQMAMQRRALMTVELILDLAAWLEYGEVRKGSPFAGMPLDHFLWVSRVIAHNFSDPVAMHDARHAITSLVDRIEADEHVVVPAVPWQLRQKPDGLLDRLGSVSKADENLARNHPWLFQICRVRLSTAIWYILELSKRMSRTQR